MQKWPGSRSRDLSGGANDFVGVEATPGVTLTPLQSPVENSIHPPVTAKCITNTDRETIADASEPLN